MIRSFSTVPSFKKQIFEINHTRSGKNLGFYWRRRGEGVIMVYFEGKPFAQTDSTTKAIFLVRDYAIRLGLYSKVDLPEHYISNIDGWFRLYSNGRFLKKSKVKKELTDYLEIISWMDQSGRGSSWGRK